MRGDEIVDQHRALGCGQLRAVRDHAIDDRGPTASIFVFLVNPRPRMADRTARIDQRLAIEQVGRRRGGLFSSSA